MDLKKEDVVSQPPPVLFLSFPFQIKGAEKGTVEVGAPPDKTVAFFAIAKWWTGEES